MVAPDTFSEISHPRPSIAKDPSAVLDYSMDWSDWLAADESIATYDVTVSGVTKDSQSRAGAVVTAWLSGGVAGTVGSATFRITTNSVPARTDERTIYLRVQER